MPAVFGYPLAKASTLGLIGRYEEGKTFVKKLRELKPDFPKKGRVFNRAIHQVRKDRRKRD
jgi:hypothetical protein